MTEKEKRIASVAKWSARQALLQARVAHATHYTVGLGATVAAAAAGYLAQVDNMTTEATLAGGVGAVLAATQTFINPRQRAAFHYKQYADYEKLAYDADPDQSRQALVDNLNKIRLRYSTDLTGG